MLRAKLCVAPCVMLRVMLQIMLRVTLCVMLPMMLYNTSCPLFVPFFFLSTSLVQLIAQFGCARGLAVLATEVYFAHYFCVHNLRFSSWRLASATGCFFCALQLQFASCTSRTTFVLKIFNLERKLRECSSCTTFARKNCEFRAGVAGVRFVHFVLNKLFAYYFRTLNLQAFSRSCGKVLRVLLLYLEVAHFEPELSRTTFVGRRSGCAAGAAGVHFAYYFCAYKLRISSWSCGSALRVLLLNLKLRFLQSELWECSSRTSFAL